MPNLYLALVHSPVKDKNGSTIASAVTNLDLHDISRTARTYGVKAFYVVTPLTDQQELVGEIVDHWVTGYGASYNPHRKEALELIRLTDTFEAAAAEIEKEQGVAPKTVVTTARTDRSSLNYADFRRLIAGETPHLLAFGTAWGLTGEFMERADHILEPISGNSDYNHLPVRAAAAIILDRLLGETNRDTGI